MNVILDTNVIISGIFFSGPPFQILTAWRDGRIRLVLSKEILNEYVQVADKISKKYNELKIDKILELITIHSEMIIPSDMNIDVCRDDSDIKFLSCAISSNTKVIVSGDRHLLELNGYSDIEIISPKKYVEKSIVKIN